MRITTLISLIVFPFFGFCQKNNPIGTYQAIGMQKTRISINRDSTFTFTSDDNPIFYEPGEFSETGRWGMSGDSILLNPDLRKKDFIESDFTEQESPADSGIVLTFNHIKRYINQDGLVIKSDTSQVMQLDYAFNDFRKKNRTRVTSHLNTCSFAGYMPKAIITRERTISIKRPQDLLKSIFIGCYEMQGVKEYAIHNPKSNRFIFNVCSNYYQDGLIRNVGFALSKNGSHLKGKKERYRKV